jgi:hypothetical protein
MNNKQLILSELAYDYGMNEQQVENLIYLLLAEDELFRYHLKTSINMKLKGE